MATSRNHLRTSTAAAAAIFAAATAAPATAVAPTETGAHTVSTPSAAPQPARAIRVPILMYHLVTEVDAATPSATRSLTVDPTDFARQMRWLDRRGYKTVTQRQLANALLRGRPLPRKPVLITFDDGYRNILFKASPILMRLRMRATAYVISGRVSAGDSSFLTWGMLRTLERRCIEIGAHTVSHRDLTSLDDREAFRELVVARRTLERRLRHRVPWLAYPFGAFDARVRRLARRAGYELAVTTVHGMSHSSKAPLELRRLRISNSTGVSGLAAMLGSRS